MPSGSTYSRLGQEGGRGRHVSRRLGSRFGGREACGGSKRVLAPCWLFLCCHHGTWPHFPNSAPQSTTHMQQTHMPNRVVNLTAASQPYTVPACKSSGPAIQHHHAPPEKEHLRCSSPVRRLPLPRQRQVRRHVCADKAQRVLDVLHQHCLVHHVDGPGAGGQGRGEKRGRGRFSAAGGRGAAR